MMLEMNDSPQSADLVVISDELAIPPIELRFRFSRSSGPGGQHVNRSETRVELLFDVAGSPTLSDAQRDRLLKRLAGYIDGEGVLHIVSSATRSQAGNRADALERFQVLVAAALRQRKPRIATRPTRAARARRLAGKRQRGQVKRTRRMVGHDDYE